MSPRGKLFTVGVVVIAGCVVTLIPLAKSEAWAEFWECATHCCVTAADPPSPAEFEAEAAARQAEALRSAAWMKVARPWHEAGRSRAAAVRLERTRYTSEMRNAPMTCRGDLRSRLPEHWTVSTLSLGQSSHAGRPGTWLVSGVLTVTDDGDRQRYRYQCRFQGSDVSEVTIAASRGPSEPVLLPAGR